jgi:eukaryotic-like serine/threonine-protein kinase
VSTAGPTFAPQLLGPSGGRGARSRGLSPDLEAAAARRLGALALVAAGAGTMLGVIGSLGLGPAGASARLQLTTTAPGIVLSLALYAVIRWGGLPARRILALGVVYEVVQGFLNGFGFYGFALEPGVAVRGWTPVAVWMMVFPLIVPAPPRRTVVATLLTALTDPLAFWAVLATGAPRPAGNVAQMFVPTAMACLLAPIAARIVYGLTVEVGRARELGSYRLVEKLGQGGMGEVWRAEHRMLARAAAIKLIRPAALGTSDGSHARELLRRFEREAQATAALRSPHTIEVYDFGLAADGSFYYVMELLEGYSLQALVDRFGPVPPERAVAFLRQACHSLHEAHRAGLVHRDVKPANLFACRRGLDVDVVKVLDFGLVKVQGRRTPGEESLTAQGTFTGTPGYMPPEVALGEEPIDGRADIYALGCVAYWLLCGQRVFEGTNAMQMVIDHVRTPPAPPSRRTSQPIPDNLERLVLRCLEKDPAARPADAGELSRELEALGLETRWSDERARQWWSAHPPVAREGEAGALDSGDGGLTQSRTRSVTGEITARPA